MDTPATSQKRPASSPLNAEACQPPASIRSISLPHVLRSATPRASHSAPTPPPNLKYLPMPLNTYIVTTLTSCSRIYSLYMKHDNFVDTLTSHSSRVPVPVTTGSETTGTFSKATLTATAANTNQKY